MKKKLTVILIFSIILLLSNCKTTTPIIIRDIPDAKLKKGEHLENYEEMTKYKAEIVAYVEELINQIVHKVPYTDLRKKKKQEAD